jgi:hypothetical protein
MSSSGDREASTPRFLQRARDPTILNAAGPSVSPAVTKVTETQGTQIDKVNIGQTERTEKEILLNMEDLILGEESQDGEYLNL